MFASNTSQVANDAVFIEDTFACHLYTGNGSTQTITNGIDLSTKGGLVWWKNRTNATGHGLIDTTRGIDYYLSSNTTDAQDGPVSYISSVSSTGYSIGAGTQFVNQSANNYASWTFRKQPKFFDVVTYTGTGATQNIAHSLGSVPGCIIVKKTSGAASWCVYHRSLGDAAYINLNLTDAASTSQYSYFYGGPSSTTFTVGAASDINESGQTFVAYLFAHDSGGFGLTGTDNVISCGSYTEGASAQDINLGYEPQWLLMKKSSGASGWYLFDTMRGMDYTDLKYLEANTSGAESSFGGAYIKPTATGFTAASGFFGNGSTIIYIAIRRGPMKVPTSGTSVFSPAAETPSGSASYVMNSSSGFPVDMLLYKERNNVATPYLTNRLTNNYLQTASTAAEASYTYGYDLMQGVRGQFNAASQVDYAFRRAPSFFDEVCYTGNGSTQNISHNLGVVPEMMIAKRRDVAGSWVVYTTTTGNSAILELSSTGAVQTSAPQWNSTTPTASVFSLGTSSSANASGSTYVWYGFATCAGVSKVGSYTGTGTTKQVDCGFTGGARFVLIKRTDSTGDWYVWDTARGIVSGNDPYLLLNSTAAETTGTDYIDTYSAGFEISSTAPAAINASGGTFIFLAIA